MSYKLSIIIPSFNTAKMTRACIQQVKDVFGSLAYEIIVIDNNSQDNTTALLYKNFPEITLIINKKNRGFAQAVNQGILKSQGEYVLLLNTDAFVNKGLLKALRYLDLNPGVGLLSPRLIYPTGKLQANFGNYPSVLTEIMQATQLYKVLPWGRVIMPNIFNQRKFKKIRAVKWLSGTCLFIRRQVLEKIKLFDENFFMYLEDIDFCRRARVAGFKIIFWGKTSIVHKHHASARNTLKPWYEERKSLLYFWQKHCPQKKISFRVIKDLNWLKLQAKKFKLKTIPLSSSQ